MSTLKLPSDNDLAKLLDLSGKQGENYRHEPGSSADNYWVCYFWRVIAKPSFHDPWVLAGMLAEDRVQPPGVGQCWRKAVLADSEHAAALNLEVDPVVEAVNRAELLSPSRNCYVDGIGYYVRVHTLQVEGDFRFSNPELPSLVELEKTLFRLAEQISAASGGCLSRVVNVWRSYLHHPLE
jgi:hypothetical protein